MNSAGTGPLRCRAASGPRDSRTGRNHTAAKSMTFLLAGRILHRYHTTQIKDVSGLLRTMPNTAGLFATGILATIGLPPFGLFISEFALIRAGFSTGHPWLMGSVLILLAVATGFAFAMACSVMLPAPRVLTLMRAAITRLPHTVRCASRGKFQSTIPAMSTRARWPMRGAECIASKSRTRHSPTGRHSPMHCLKTSCLTFRYATNHLISPIQATTCDP